MIDQAHWYGPGPHKTCPKCEFCEQCGPNTTKKPCATHPAKGSDQ